MPEPAGTQGSTESSYRERLYDVIKFLITWFGGHLIYQKTSFDEHAVIMIATYVTLCLYALITIAESQRQSEEPYLPMIKTFSPLIGFLVVVLELAILNKWLGIIAFIIWGLFLLYAARTHFSEIVGCLRQIFSDITRCFNAAPSHPEGDNNGSSVQTGVELV